MGLSVEHPYGYIDHGPTLSEASLAFSMNQGGCQLFNGDFSGHFGGYHITLPSYLTFQQPQISFASVAPEVPAVGFGIQYRKYFHPTQ
jgi:hypothetical protein